MEAVDLLEHKKAVEILARTFAKDLMQNGFEKDDLVQAATTILDEAIVSHPLPKIPPKRTHLKVVNSG